MVAPLIIAAIIAAVCSVISLGMSIYTMLTMKNPEPPVPAPNAVNNIPTAEQGKAIPIVFGTRFVTQPNVVWWGNTHNVSNTVNP